MFDDHKQFHLLHFKYLINALHIFVMLMPLLLAEANIMNWFQRHSDQ